MTQQIREVMTSNPVILDASASVSEAARQMRERDVGNVLVQREGALCGIVTDRDIVIRCLADGHDAASQKLQDLCSEQVETLEADASIEDAVELMRERAVRRLPVVDSGAAIGIVSLGDLAQSRDPKSALGEISAAPADH